MANIETATSLAVRVANLEAMSAILVSAAQDMADFQFSQAMARGGILQAVKEFVKLKRRLRLALAAAQLAGSDGIEVQS